MNNLLLHRSSRVYPYFEVEQDVGVKLIEQNCYDVNRFFSRKKKGKKVDLPGFDPGTSNMQSSPDGKTSKRKAGGKKSESWGEYARCFMAAERPSRVDTARGDHIGPLAG